MLGIRIKTRGQEEFLNIPALRTVNPFSRRSVDKSGIFMNGQEIYKFAVSSAENGAVEMAEAVGISLDSIDYFSSIRQTEG
jgi:3-oxoacyl-[acyl-carrier-protein] synthase-3